MPDDIKKLLEDHKDEIKRHFDVVAEDTKSEIKTYTEQIATNTTKLTLLQKDVKSLKKDMTKVRDDVSVIKTTLEGTESEKPLKVRVEDLEAKVNAP